jgi:hypothetical protein
LGLFEPSLFTALSYNFLLLASCSLLLTPDS